MLGLGNSISSSSLISGESVFVDPNSVSGTVGWWDFTVAGNMYTDTGSTNVSSDGDLIKRIDNSSTSGNKLGVFLEAPFSGNRPAYKTGGTNSKTYAKFDGSNDALRCWHQSGSSSVGGIETNKLSNSSVMRLDNYTLYYVAKADIATPTSDEIIIHMSAYDDSNENNMVFLKHPDANVSGGTDDEPTVSFYTQSTSEGPGAAMVTDQLLTTNTELWTIRSDGDSSSFYKNANTSLGLTGHDIGIEGKMTWNRTDSGGSFFQIGSQGNAAGNVAINGFDGDVYEMILIERAVTDAENTSIENYLMTKYDL